MVTTPDDTALQKGTLTPAQKEQTGSAKAVSLIESLAAGTPVYLKVQLYRHNYKMWQLQN